jgi:hypothetical protein
VKYWACVIIHLDFFIEGGVFVTGYLDNHSTSYDATGRELWVLHAMMFLKATKVREYVCLSITVESFLSGKLDTLRLNGVFADFTIAFVISSIVCGRCILP